MRDKVDELQNPRQLPAGVLFVCIYQRQAHSRPASKKL